MTYLLDTNAWIQFLNIPNAVVTQRLSLLQPNDVRLCTVVMAELYYGAWKSSRHESNLARLQGLWSQFEIVDFDQRSASVYGRIRASLESQGTPIGGNDLILVTHNTREFARVEGLAIEDWEI
jgi:tRNA(fMet)-specific endonuclease VapC